jgi:cytochrome P450
MTTIERETSAAVAKLPPGPPFPRAVQGALALANRRIALQILRRVYGSAFTIDLPIFGQLVVISDPNDIRQLFKTAPHIADTTETNLGRVMGPNSMFALTGDRHRAQRKSLTPSFNGRRLSAYEAIIEREAVDEFATWPSDRTFATMPSMMRITLNVILRAVFGAEGQELERLREILAWAVERLQRHPQLLDRLVADVDAGSEELLTATIFEILRTRPVIDTTFRQVTGPTLQIGPWTLPQEQTIVASIGLLHADESVFHDAHRFDPDRFMSRRPDPAE